MTASQLQAYVTSMKIEVGETLVANQRVLKYSATGLRTGFEYLLLGLNIR